ncbi:DUF1345 domain-containing protein [Novosphingobium sp. SL115]|uniref:DUF1345 domain-containing protein n=1 Tax=Novosphingobium sp. SL115 TaxID=2995150 RepID=UPI0022761D60|nr:DUF1345 domain-containing protein [Novosphingobium sp. SL115]MCY1670683.1 DUF1345 domain-containing protein [Novosphingobium sp. SL115]
MAARGGKGLGNRLAPPRYVVFLAVFVAGLGGYLLMPGGESLADGVAMAFDVAAAIFLLSLIPLLRDSNTGRMRLHSAENDANRVLVLGITTLATIVILAAISGELPRAQTGDHVAMAKLVGTLLLTWLFANSVYALHYAHLFYSAQAGGGDSGGIDFPDTRTPDYLDFAYFSFTLGMTFQTSDCAITSRTIRRIVTLHSFAAFVFNIGIIAFTINALG